MHTQVTHTPDAGPSSTGISAGSIEQPPSYAAASSRVATLLPPTTQAPGPDTPPPPPAYRSHRRVVLWPAPFPSSPDPLLACDITKSLPSTDEFGAEEIRGIAPGCCCEQCEVRLVEDRRGERMAGRVVFGGHGDVLWTWMAREGEDKLERWPRSGIGVPGAVWRMDERHDMVGVCAQNGVRDVAQDGNEIVTMNRHAAPALQAVETVAVGDHGIVRCAITADGKAVCWRTDSAAYARFMSSSTHSDSPSVGGNGQDAYVYPLDTPSTDKIPYREQGWTHWCPFAATSYPGAGGQRRVYGEDMVLRIAAGGMAVALKANGQVWVGAMDAADEAWHLLCVVEEPETVGLAAAGRLVALYRLPSTQGGCAHWEQAAAYVVRIPEPNRRSGDMGGENEDCDVVQVHTVLARDPAPNDGLLELALRPLSIPAPSSAPGTSTSVGGKERKLSIGLAAKGRESDEKRDEKDEQSKGERKLSFGAKFIVEAARRASISTPSTSTSSAAKSHSPAQERRPSQSISTSPLSLEGYEGAARTSTGELYAWNMRWPTLPAPGLDVECGVVLLPPMTAQLVSLPPGERESTLFPVSVGVRCAVCVTVGESEDAGTIKEKVKRAWKGKGRVTMMRFDGTTVL